MHTIGNLTLVTKSLNPALSNAPWKDKRDELKKSILIMNAHLQVVEQWDEDEISVRSQRLFNAAKVIWKRPS